MGLSYDNELADVQNDAYVSGSVSVTSVQIEAKVGASRLAGRELITILNKGPNRLYYGPTGVTTVSGSILEKNQFLSLNAGDAIGIFMICSSGQTATAIVQEMA